MHLRLGQAAWHDAQDQTSRPSQCRCRFHAQSDRLQSDPPSQTAGGVARTRETVARQANTPRPTAPKTRQRTENAPLSRFFSKLLERFDDVLGEAFCIYGGPISGPSNAAA